MITRVMYAHTRTRLRCFSTMRPDRRKKHILSLASEGFRRFLASEGSRRFLVRAGKMVSRTHTVSQLVGFEVKFLTRLNLGIL